MYARMYVCIWMFLVSLRNWYTFMSIFSLTHDFLEMVILKRAISWVFKETAFEKGGLMTSYRKGLIGKSVKKEQFLLGKRDLSCTLENCFQD